MKAKPSGYLTIDEYIAEFPKPVQKKLKELRKTISKSIPEATEKISYQIPTFHLHKNIVHFAAYENHIGFYPGPRAIIEFKDQLKGYKTSKGTIQFPIEDAIPLGLIKDVVKFNVKMVLDKKKKR